MSSFLGLLAVSILREREKVKELTTLIKSPIFPMPSIVTPRSCPVLAIQPVAPLDVRIVPIS